MQRQLFAALAALFFSASVFAATAAPSPAPVAAIAPPPLTDFLKRDAFDTMKISPTGEYIAATVPLSDRTSLVILRRSDLKVTGHVTLPKDSHVLDFYWANDKRILFDIGTKFGWLDRPQYTGEIYGVNADGSGQGPSIYSGYFFHRLQHDDKHVLVANGYQIERMDVVSGYAFDIATSPPYVIGTQFLIDPASTVRFAWGHKGSDHRIKTYYRANADAKWELINDEVETGLQVTPIGFAADGKTAYLQVEEANAPDAIFAFDTTTGKREIEYRDDNTSPSYYLYSPVDDSIYAAVYEDGKPRVQHLDADNPFARQLRGMQASFPGAMVLPTSYTKDGAIAMYYVYSDRIPADYYLFDRSTNRAVYVASKADGSSRECSRRCARSA